MKTGAIALGLGAWLLAAAGAQGTLWDGGTENPFELGAGARALAMGGAYPAVADDVTALFWNPAGLARLDQLQVSAMHINLFFDTPYDFLGAAYPLLDWGTLAAGAVRLGTDGIVERNADSTQANLGDGVLDLREYLFGFGREWFDLLSLGTVLKIDQERLLGNEDTGVGLDLGVLAHGLKGWPGGLHWENMSAGINLQNVFGSHLRVGETADVLPLNLRAGLAYTVDLQDRWQQKILLALSTDKSTWRDWRLRAGMEYRLFEWLALRGGLNSDGWSLGAGANYFGIAFDYALTDQELGLTHRFSLTYCFGPHLAEQREARRLQLEREVAAKAEAEIQHMRDELDAELKKNEARYQQEKKALLSKQDKMLSNAVESERQKQAEQRNRELALQYFKSLHYFNGLKDLMNKEYKEAVAEFEIVAKYDPNYMELPYYLGRARQLAKGQFSAIKPENLPKYYQGIDLYMDNKFDDAIAAWKQILVTEPNNLTVLRNIEEAQNRANTLQKAESAPASAPSPVPGMTPSTAPSTAPNPAASPEPVPAVPKK